jgi:spermidine synthase
MDSGTNGIRQSVVALVLGLALLGSGFSGLSNEVLWQRSLKRFLGGSETISSTIVVMVFMGGLGIGAIAMGRYARRARDPLRWLAALEGLLCLVNLGVCVLLQSGLSSTVFALQAWASTLGLPLPLLYALGAGAVLLLPCLLMGATIPLASEVCQRRLGQTDARVLGLVFAVNTLGAMGGCVLGSTVLVPAWGLVRSMMGAAALNAMAALVLLGLRSALPPAHAPALQDTPRGAERPIWRGSTEEILAFGLGFCALAYEMLLLRISTLVHEPQPATFSMVLTGYLLFWSVGAGLGSRSIPIPLGLGLLLTPFFAALGLLAALNTLPSELSGAVQMLDFVLTHPSPFLPCLLFGFLFTRVTAQAASDWGRDVGRVYGWNTVGACSGILAAIFIGYELHLYLFIGLIVGLCLFIAAFYFDRVLDHRIPFFSLLGGGAVLLLLLSTRLVESESWGLTRVIDPSGDTRFFFGRSGVVGVGTDGSVYWDGLWHSHLVFEEDDHIDTNNWWMAVAPVMAHSTGDIKHIGLVGMGTGITAATLARLGSVERIDAYEINHTLESIFAEYPQETMGAAQDPRISLLWQDARTGLALREQQYDIITTAPLYLRQAGSGILNSLESYELIRSRLKPGGIACVFSWGTDAQAFTVRQTAAQVFQYQKSIWGGYLLLLSDSPIELNAQVLLARMTRHHDDPLWAEIIEFAGPLGASGLASVVDKPQFDWGDGRLLTTDDHPIVEYPAQLDQRAHELGYDLSTIALPPPGAWSNDFAERKWLAGMGI